MSLLRRRDCRLQACEASVSDETITNKQTHLIVQYLRNWLLYQPVKAVLIHKAKLKMISINFLSLKAFDRHYKHSLLQYVFTNISVMDSKAVKSV